MVMVILLEAEGATISTGVFEGGAEWVQAIDGKHPRAERMTAQRHDQGSSFGRRNSPGAHRISNLVPQVGFITV